MLGQEQEFIRAMNRQVNRLFKQSFNFETAIVAETDSDNGRLTTTRGYNTNGLESLGNTGSDKARNGQSVVQMNAAGPGSLPFVVGPTDWFGG